MKRGIFASAWEEAMSRHKVYKKEKLREIRQTKREFREEVGKRSTGILSGIILYYLGQMKKTLKQFSNRRNNKK